MAAMCWSRRALGLFFAAICVLSPLTTAAKPKAPRPAHQQGRRPKKPKATLPSPSSRAASDEPARRRIAGGELAERLVGRVNDPELSALRAAERVLFPRRLEGFRPGWSWGETDPAVQASGLPPVSHALPSATLDDATHAEWLRSLELPDIPVRMTPRVVEYLKFYRDTKRGQAIARVWVKKVGRYTGAIRAELAKLGLPQDLAWLSLIESGHNPIAASPAGAAGLWQFMPSSGRLYGLTVDRWVDERLDPRRATQAAARFLSDLYQRFGTWELAMAAYNMGHAGLLRSVRKYNTNDFWRLSEYEAGIPWETTLYVPKILAIAVVMNNRRAFGLAKLQADPPILFDTIFVSSSRTLKSIADAAGIPLDSLRAMNPQYLQSRIPPAAKGKKGARKWPVVVPRGVGKRTISKLLKLGKNRTYAVRFGDTLETIAARTGVTEASLNKLNGLVSNASLVAGSVLLLEQGKQSRFSPDKESVVVVSLDKFHAPNRRRVFYRVLSKDTLAAVGAALGVSRRELVAWNGLDEVANLQSGMVLQAYVAGDADLSKVRVVETKDTDLLDVGSVAFTQYFEQLKGRVRLTIRAKKGDTLRRIGKRHGLSVGTMERINRFSRHRSLKPNDTVVVYTKRKMKNRPRVAEKPLAQIGPSR